MPISKSLRDEDRPSLLATSERCTEASDFIGSRSRLPADLKYRVIMSVPAPHFLLFSESRIHRGSAASSLAPGAPGSWRFKLEAVDGSDRIDISDEEQEHDGERLELLAIVRGLEALDQPSRVTLITRRPSISRGLRFGLDQWRENNWQWECFGQMAPVKDADLWQRVDRALGFHDVRCRSWRFDPPANAPQTAAVSTATSHRRARTARPAAKGAGLWQRCIAVIVGLLFRPRFAVGRHVSHAAKTMVGTAVQGIVTGQLER